MTSTAPPLGHVLESVLYTENMARAQQFFETVMGLESFRRDERFTSYPTGNTMLLLFQKGQTGDTVVLPEGMGTIPPHDGSGRTHLAFAIEAESLPAWETHLTAHRVEIEGRTHWPGGSDSIYFRDPDGHLLELATPGLWPNY
ncbi:VOC family protein [Larsenimonas suaedae]|uniref:VOC family protein n=1 Tax=Larsenimonas suaedae TaxID=1851019 RepID=A0ABU1GX00_9GAMM|nr:VOC family protein [Larsenimonas suaedae]MCM2973139.1 VOC family protein [Larsenimonas suaedae]MDR5896576.1 VOC family protein [Larsenimonas suaedae]